MTGVAALKLARDGAESRSGAERHELAQVVIGKDVLELVSSAMYVDPMTVFREYIQNAADAVDAARAAGELGRDEAGKVEITTDPSARTVRIRDNGCGVAFSEFGRKLTALGGSSKRGTTARGFRGVGRLAGLGYAQELVFRSRVRGEEKCSELRWDCRKLKAALRDSGDEVGIIELIRSVTTLERVAIAGAPERFFEVELKGLVRLRNDRLVSPAAIGEYLCQVAPVPFSPEFRFGEKITEALSRYCDLGELDIRIDGAEAPLYRPHRDQLTLAAKSSITFDELSIIEIPSIDGEVGGIAWVGHHEYEGAVPTGTLVKGLRLRAGNIQVGDHALLEDLFPEPRFNAWSIGEVHVFDRRIVPNGRRDHFEQNAHFHNLLNHLTPTTRDIAKRCRTNSVRRKWEREFDLNADSAEETLAILEQGGVKSTERERLAVVVEQSLLRMAKVAGMELLQEQVAERLRRTNDLRHRLSLAMNDVAPVSSPLERLPPEQKAIYQDFFTLIYECSANRVAAKALVDRILMKLGQ